MRLGARLAPGRHRAALLRPPDALGALCKPVGVLGLPPAPARRGHHGMAARVRRCAGVGEVRDRGRRDEHRLLRDLPLLGAGHVARRFPERQALPARVAVALERTAGRGDLAGEGVAIPWHNGSTLVPCWKTMTTLTLKNI